MDKPYISTAENIKEKVASLGLELVGIIDAQPLQQTRKLLIKRHRLGYCTGFESTNFFTRTDPASLLPGAKSIVILALPYKRPEHPYHPAPPPPRGKVARCARGIDYHRVLEEKALQLVEFLQKELSGSFSYRIGVDKTSLVERALAQKAGGRIGNHGAYISPRYGSWAFLGEVLLDLPLTPYRTTGPFSGEAYCSGCGACRESCPAGAIGPDAIDPTRCISYLTQYRGFLPPELRKTMGLHTYGCDSCQEACPANQGALYSPLEEMGHVFFPAEPSLIPFMRMSKKEFELTVGLTSAGWCGKRTLLRNAIINLGNSRDEAAVPSLDTLLTQDPRKEIRGYAAWSLGAIGSGQARRALDMQRTRESEKDVKKEIEEALENG